MWTLDRDLFRYLVGVYALVLILDGTCIAYEMFAPGWREFSSASDLLIDEHFGTPDDTQLIVGFCFFVVALAWHLAALVGLRKFNRWARLGFWASVVAATVAVYGAGGFVPYFAGPLSSTVTEIGTGLFAVILLLSYSREHGAVWFRKPLETLKETF